MAVQARADREAQEASQAALQAQSAPAMPRGPPGGSIGLTVPLVRHRVQEAPHPILHRQTTAGKRSIM